MTDPTVRTIKMTRSYEERLRQCNNPLLKKLLTIMIEKQTNLCVAANFHDIESLILFLDRAGQHICMLKTQLFSLGPRDLEQNLALIARKKKQYNFLLFEDPKFGDGQEVVEGYYKVYAEHADLVTVNPLPFGHGVFDAIESVAQNIGEPRGCLAVCEVSFAKSKSDPEYCFKVAQEYPNTCIGIIAQKFQVPNGSTLIKLTPGIHMSQTTDGKNQQWNHPSQAIKNGSDVIIVGRGITSAPDNLQEEVTRKYKEVAWQAYLDEVSIYKN